MFLADRGDMFTTGVVKPSVLHSKPLLSDLVACEQGRAWSLRPPKIDDHDMKMEGSKSRNRSILTKTSKKNPFASRQKPPPAFVLFAREPNGYTPLPPSSWPGNRADGTVRSASSLCNLLLVRGVAAPTVLPPPCRMRASKRGEGRVVINAPDRSAHCYLNQPEWPRPEHQRKKSRNPEEKVKCNDLRHSGEGRTQPDHKQKHTRDKSSRGQSEDSEYDETFVERIKSILALARSAVGSSGSSSPAPVKGILKSSSSCMLPVTDGRGLDSPTGSNSRSSTKSQKRVQFRGVGCGEGGGRAQCDGDKRIPNGIACCDDTPHGPIPSEGDGSECVDNDFIMNRDRLGGRSFDNLENSADIRCASPSEKRDVDDCPFTASPFPREDGGFTPQAMRDEEPYDMSVHPNEQFPVKIPKASRRSLQNPRGYDTVIPSRRPKFLGTRNRSGSQRSDNPGTPDLMNSNCPETPSSKSHTFPPPTVRQSPHIAEDDVVLSRHGTLAPSEMAGYAQDFRSNQDLRYASEIPMWIRQRDKTIDSSIANTNVSKKSTKLKGPKGNKVTMSSAVFVSPTVPGGICCKIGNAPISSCHGADIRNPGLTSRAKTPLVDRRETPSNSTGGQATDEKTMRIIRWLYDTEPPTPCPETDRPRTVVVRHPGGVGFQ
ncbi:uncharacterized protein LOC101851865 [Aplysia californica]|uniref:Uncharacterized protein LOC101851865 n=1 Tax=Aplysia californica TaxID=6500 RepID=A0ABM0JNZ0_APLCA|nr:uncharacterized protein LOC101851865 [Aplysia californica]